MSTKVLFFSHDGKLGDAIVNTAFVAGLKRHDPRCEIHATVAGVTEAFWSHDERVARRWRMQKPGFGDIIRLGLALRRERYDFIVTWQRMRSEKNRLLLWLARPREVIDLHEFNRGEVRHKVEACGEALAQMRRRPEGELAYDVRIAPRCERLDSQLGEADEVIVINLFAADAERTVGHREGVELLRRLHAQSSRAALCVLCTDQTRAQAEEVIAQAEAGQVVNCDGDLNRLFRLCERADLVISPDTAVVHIASAFDTPVIGIYQNNGVKPVQWGPRGGATGIVLSQSATTLEGFSVPEVVNLATKLRNP